MVGIAPDPLVTQGSVLLCISAVITWDLEEYYAHTLTGGIDDFHKAHFIVHHKLFSICVLYCRIVCLEIGVSW